jgi:transcriptional regulator with XRE-family HTH domain
VSPEKRAAAKRLGGNLRREREAEGLSRERLARIAQVSVDAIYNTEQAKSMPRLGTFLLLAGALEIEPVDLLEGVDPETA